MYTGIQARQSHCTIVGRQGGCWEQVVAGMLGTIGRRKQAVEGSRGSNMAWNCSRSWHGGETGEKKVQRKVW